MKRIFYTGLFSIFILGCSELKNVGSQLPELLQQNQISTLDIASALKEALHNGITKEVSQLTVLDGFYKNSLVKITFPEEIQVVDQTLRSIGMGSLVDEGVKLLNRAAEDAVKEATPIFVDAIKEMTFTDAKNILMGGDDAATSYLEKSTSSKLLSKFQPVVQSSLGKVGANKAWEGIINQYNKIPLVSKINPDLNDYVTKKAMNGVYKMIAIEEKEIRTNVSARNSAILQKVFALQDKN